MSYSPTWNHVFRTEGNYVGRILAGAQPHRVQRAEPRNTSLDASAPHRTIHSASVGERCWQRAQFDPQPWRDAPMKGTLPGTSPMNQSSSRSVTKEWPPLGCKGLRVRRLASWSRSLFTAGGVEIVHG
jgi:hypothetical protein